jgi:hypothetical protein
MIKPENATTVWITRSSLLFYDDSDRFSSSLCFGGRFDLVRLLFGHNFSSLV